MEIVHLIFPMEISTTKLEKVYDQKSLHAAMKDRITEIKILSYKWLTPLHTKSSNKNNQSIESNRRPPRHTA